ncbi:MAG: 4-hydroxythreonine-4-phosphate dehydrogenase PdxA [Chthoniobacterales bacterium]
MMKVIGLTAGDLSGIGPEILAATINYFKKDPALLCGSQLKIIGAAAQKNPGQPTRETALAAIASLEEAARLAVNGELSAVVTGPINKKQLHEAGFPFPGQTEFFAARAGVENFGMLLTGGKLTVALVSIHLPLGQAVATLRKEEIVRVGNLLVSFLTKRQIKNRCIAVAGLNPHAGEEGDIGMEEIKIIAPALAELSKNHSEIKFVGPLSPDTVFCRAVHGEFDAVLCMYHDQGLIPLKLHAFDEGVNVTLGLPFIRTSPDHGTAYEIAGRGLARADSYIAAVKLAATLINGKRTRK